MEGAPTVESCLQPLRQVRGSIMGLGADWGWARLVVASCCFGGLIQVKSLALPLGSPRAFKERLVRS